MAPYKKRSHPEEAENQIVEETSLEDEQYDGTCPRKRSSLFSRKVAVENSVSSGKLWTEDEEIAILNGMICFRNEKDLDPMADTKALYHFICGQSDDFRDYFSIDDLSKKLSKMQNQYKDILMKGIMECSSHEIRVFKLSKQVWVDCASSANVKDVTKLCLREMKRFHEENERRIHEDVLKDRLKSLDKKRKAEFMQMLNEYQLAEQQLCLKSAQIQGRQTKLLLDAFKKSKQL